MLSDDLIDTLANVKLDRRVRWPIQQAPLVEFLSLKCLHNDLYQGSAG